MGRVVNVFLIAAAAVLVLFGVAAQTGTISFADRVQAPHQVAPASQKSSHIQPSPSPTSAPPAPAPPNGGGGGGEGDGD